MPFRTKRAYDPPSPEDGLRVLVDRIWPRGLSKEKARVDWWARELAPSDALRRWFAHDPGKYAEFVRRYREELKGNPALARLKALGKEGMAPNQARLGLQVGALGPPRRPQGSFADQRSPGAKARTRSPLYSSVRRRPSPVSGAEGGEAQAPPPVPGPPGVRGTA